MLTDAELHVQIFELVKHYVWAAGGDGDGFIISPQYKKLKELADEFENYEKATDNCFVERIDRNDAITFQDHQEAIVFALSRNAVPFYGSDIVIEVSA